MSMIVALERMGLSQFAQHLASSCGYKLKNHIPQTGGCVTLKRWIAQSSVSEHCQTEFL